MLAFEEYLKGIGYRAFSQIFSAKKRKHVLYIPLSDVQAGFFSTMVEGRCHNIWTNCSAIFELADAGLPIPRELTRKNILVGLSELGKPPTLIEPRPKSVVNDNKSCDDQMNRLLKSHSCEEIYQLISS